MKLLSGIVMFIAGLFGWRYVNRKARELRVE